MFKPISKQIFYLTNKDVVYTIPLDYVEKGIVSYK